MRPTSNFANNSIRRQKTDTEWTPTAISYKKAVESIITVKDESDIDSLFSEGNTTALAHKVKGLDDSN